MRNWLIAVLFSVIPLAAAQEAKTITLPKPRTSGGMPLMQALAERQTTRDFSEEKLSPQMLSDLLWAANGINRPDGRRTAPSPHNAQEVDVYVVTSDGAYVYEAKPNALRLVAAGDFRAATGKQDFVGKAAVNLVYVADYSRLGDASAEDKLLYSGATAGFIGQNVYLYCASEGLGAVVRAWVDKEALAKTLQLKPQQRVILAHTVGFRKK